MILQKTYNLNLLIHYLLPLIFFIPMEDAVLLKRTFLFKNSYHFITLADL